MGVGITRRDMGLIQLQTAFYQLLPNGLPMSQLLEQVGHGMAPGLRAYPLEDGLHCLFRGLLGREAGPIIIPALKIALSVL